MRPILYLLIGLMIVSVNFVRAEPIVDWNFKLELVPHKIELKVGEPYALYDGKRIRVSPPKLIDGRFYLELSTFKALNFATKINEQQSYVDLSYTSNYHPNFWVRYRFNQDYSYRLDSLGGRYQIDKNTKPIRVEGKLYLPFKYFDELLGRKVSFSKQHMLVEWKELLIDKQGLAKATSDKTFTAKILYEEPLYLPIIYNWTDHAGAGYSLQASSTIDEVIDKKTFKVAKFVLNLSPGLNAFDLYQMKGNQSHSFNIERLVDDPTAISIEYLFDEFLNKNPKVYIDFTSPQGGFLNLGVGEVLPITGSLLQELGDNQLTLAVARFDGRLYKSIINEPLMTAKMRFNHNLTFKEKGFYLIEISSPKHVPHIDGMLSTKWVRFKVKVD